MAEKISLQEERIGTSLYNNGEKTKDNHMTRKIILIMMLLVAGILTSCKDSKSDYDDYTWDGTNYTDADYDGIPDVAEEKDTSFYDMPLYDWGARPGVPDLFIHIAPMDPGLDVNYPSYPDGGMLLQKTALDRVTAAFAAQGIAVHFDVGKTGLYDGYSEITDRGKSTYNLSGKDHSVPYNDSIALDAYSGTNSTFAFVDDLKAEHFPSKRNQIFYFMVMGSSQNADGSGGSSGVAWLGGRDFLITLGKWGLGFGTNSALGLTYDNYYNYVVNRQASTIMHEFGHNLGLRHGGNEDVNYKPNYYSIMNYLYQLTGLSRIGTDEGDRYYRERFIESNGADTHWRDLITRQFPPNLYEFDLKDSSFTSTFRMNFSHGEGGSLNEASLVESDGLKQTGSIAVDWNGSSTFQSVSNYNVNPSNDSTTNSVLTDYNDWGNLYFYYNTHHAGSERTVIDTTLELQEETNSPTAILPFDRSR